VLAYPGALPVTGRANLTRTALPPSSWSQPLSASRGSAIDGPRYGWGSAGPGRVGCGGRLPRRRPRRRRKGSEIRLPGAPQPNTVWAYDFIHDRLAKGTAPKLLCVLDEHTRESLTIEVGRWIRSQDVILPLSRLMKLYGKPQHIRSDNGIEFTATAAMKWLRDQNVSPAFITPGSPWKNGYVESSHGKLWDEYMNRE
jgi:putative transposase